MTRLGPLLSKVVMVTLVVGIVRAIPRDPTYQDTPRALHDTSRALQDTIPLHKLFNQDNNLANLVDHISGSGVINNELLNEDQASKTPSPPKFDINTFTFNKKNIRKPGDIFSLLADVEDSVPTKNEKPTKQKEEISSSTSNNKKTDTTKASGLNLANIFGKNILTATKDLEDLLAVVQRMKKKVEKKMGDNPSTTPANITSDTASHLVNLLLNTTKLEQLRTATLTAKTDDEFLDHLTSVLAGPETRSKGAALTLDPVTIIALLTLAAYLIRAVYQILTVTSGTRAIEDMMLPLHLSDVPQAMVAVHNWISNSELVHSRQERSVPYVSTILDIPGNLAAMIKLHREGHKPCVKQFLCEQLQDRTFPEVTLTDIFIAAMGYYFGDSDLGNYIDTTLSRSTDASCAVVPYGCSPRTLSDAHYLEHLYTSASYKFFNLLAAMTGLL